MSLPAGRRRAVILGNGKWERPEELRALLRKGDWLIACDGAYDKARRIGLKPHVIIGDFDSISRGRISDSGVEIRRHKAEKDETDGELALRLALDGGAREILWYAALGNRWDQSVANLFMLEQAAARKTAVCLLQGRWRIHLVLRRLEIAGKAGERISLIPLSESAAAVSAKGVKYPLRSETLRRSSARGVSNELTSDRCTITVGRGWLLVLHERSGDRRYTIGGVNLR